MLRVDAIPQCGTAVTTPNQDAAPKTVFKMKAGIQNSKACDRVARIFSASTIASIRRKSS